MDKKVFFLGAGFSKAINPNYPLLKDLTENVNLQLEKGSLAQHYEEIAPEIKKDVEALLTYLSTDFPWKSDTTKYENQALYAAISKIISDKFINLSSQNVAVSTEFEYFSKHIAEHMTEYDFITLNYDLLLENLLKDRIEGSTYEDFYKYPMLSVASREGPLWGRNKIEDAPAILKLHGSANWFWAGITAGDTLYYSIGNESEDSKAGLKPYIIPPVMDKNAFYNHIAIRYLWQEAEQLLKNAAEIYIIGFSFPATDTSVRFLFQSALRRSNAKIFIVNPDKEVELRKNYDKVFGKGNIKVCYDYTGKNEKDYEVVTRFIDKKILSSLNGEFIND